MVLIWFIYLFYIGYVQDYSNSWDVCDDIYMNDYKPTKKEYNILLDRGTYYE
jgi:hypothetical protein